MKRRARLQAKFSAFYVALAVGAVRTAAAASPEAA